MGCCPCVKPKPDRPANYRLSIPRRESDRSDSPRDHRFNESFSPGPPPPLPPRLTLPSPIPISFPSPSSEGPSKVNLNVPIYVAIETYDDVQSTDEIPFEEGDEFKYISDYGMHQLCLQHLRTGRTGLVEKNLVRPDPSSPLRLAINDRGIINQCLSKDNRPGDFIIRGSRHNAMEYVLSINQMNPERNCEQWHYLIVRDPETCTFYFRDESKLHDLKFPSFHRLVKDRHVRHSIPLNRVLPHVIEFEDEVWNIPLHQLNIGEKIGQGEFGEVFRGVWKHGTISTSVAIKKIRTKGITAAVRQEVEAMKTLTNLYIVALKGVTKDPLTNDIYLVTEYMENGDLKSWLMNLPQLPPADQIYRFASHISTGMAYLESRNYCHRDLACRNILVGPNASTVRIADFGLSTIVYHGDPQRQKENAAEKLAFRWLAPELFLDRAEYSIKSDVWSYGILLIEIWLKGDVPYHGNSRIYVQSFVLNGEIHPKPSECPSQFYKMIICQCLKFDRVDRPTFKTLKQLLHEWRNS